MSELAKAENPILSRVLEGVPTEARDMARAFMQVFADRPSDGKQNLKLLVNKLGLHFHQQGVTESEAVQMVGKLEVRCRFMPTIQEVLEALEEVRAENREQQTRETWASPVDMVDPEGHSYLVPRASVDKCLAEGWKHPEGPTPRSVEEAKAIIDATIGQFRGRGK